jgi:hypothetical protein
MMETAYSFEMLVFTCNSEDLSMETACPTQMLVSTYKTRNPEDQDTIQ